MGSHITPFAADIVQNDELGILVESRLLKFSGEWRVEETAEIKGNLVSSLNYDYLINFDNHNHLVLPDDIPDLLSQLKQSAPGGNCELNFRMINSDGSISRFTARGRLIEPAIAELEDSQLEADLELESKLLRYTEIAADTGSWKWNLTLNEILFSNHVYVLLGLDPRMELKSWDDFLRYVHKNDRHKIGELSSLSHKAGKVTKVDFRIERFDDKTLRYIRAKAEVFTTSVGERFCIGAMHDVSGEKLAEIKIKATHQLALQKEKEANNRIQSHEALFKEAEIVGGIGSYEAELPSWNLNFSDNMFRLTGYKPQAFKPTMEFIDSISLPEDVKEIHRILEQAIERRRNYTYTRRIILPNGTLRYITSKGKVVCDTDGNPVRILGIAQDETDQRMATLAARKDFSDDANGTAAEHEEKTIDHSKNSSDVSGDLLQSVIQSDIAALSVLKPVYSSDGNTVDFEWIMANKLQKALARGQDLIGKKYTQVFPSSIDNGTFGLLRKVYTTGERAINEFYHEDHNIRGWFRGVYVKENNLLIVTAEDVTEAKKAEKELRDEHNRLKEAQAIGHIGSFEWIAKKNIVRWSDEMYRIHGLQPQSELLTLEKVLSFIHPDDLSRVKEIFVDIRRKPMKQSITHRAILKDGSVRDFVGTFESFAGEDGRVTHFSGTVQDVTKMKIAQDEVERSLRLLQQAEEVAEMGSWEYIIKEDRFTWSEGTYRMFSLSKGDKVTPETYLDFVIPEDKRTIYRIISCLRKSHTSFEEVIRISADARIKTIKVKGTVLMNATNEAEKFLGVNLDITAIVESEKELKEQAHLINNIVETSPDMLAVIRLGSTKDVEYANAEAFLNQGFDIGAIQKLSREARMELVHPDDRDLVRYFFDRFLSMEDEIVNSVEFRVQNNVAVWQWFRARGKIFRRDESKHPTHCLVVAQNINMQRLAEERVIEQSHYIQRLVETVPDTIFIYDLNLKRLIYSNPEVYQLLGYTPDEAQLLGDKIFLQCVHPDDVASQQKALRDLMDAEDAEVTDEVFRMVHKDGPVKFVQARRTPFKRSRNGKVSQIVAIFHDITAVKKAEQENVHMKELLAARAESRYRELFSTMDEGFSIVEVLFDAHNRACDFRFVECNPAFEKLTNIQCAPGKTIRELLDGIEDYWFHLYGEVARTGQPNRFVQKAGALGNRWFEVYAFPTGEPESNRVAILFSDISERRNTEIQLRELNKKLQESDRAKTDFFSNVSHEFRTPLTLLLAPLEDLMKHDGERIGEREVEKLKLAHRNALRLQKLVNTLLDFSRIEAGRSEAIFQPTNIAKYTEELASNFRSPIETAGLKFVVKCRDAGEPVYVSRDMYEKILFNLLSNAFKFTFEGKIEVLLKSNKKHVQLIVRDTGIGISRDNLNRIFERFNRINGARSRTFEGSGIGLALVRELVAIHSGKIKVDSTMGQGSEFIVIIPRGKSHLDPKNIFESADSIVQHRNANAFVQELVGWLGVNKQSVNNRSSAKSNSTNSLKESSILIVDDNADMRAYLNSLLGESYETILAENGMKALEVLNKGKIPDLILADVMMPEMNGFELLHAVKTSEKWKGIPVILVSARAGEDSRIEGFEVGADDYLTKPFSARELRARIDSRIEICNLRNHQQKQLQDANYDLERKVLERTSELRQSRDDLRIQKDILQRCIDAMPQLIWTADPLGDFLMFNERWYTFTGLVKENTEGKNYVESGVIHPSQVKEIRSKWQQSINEGVPYSNETLIRSVKGEYCWHLDLVMPIKNEAGEIFMWVGTLTNVHDQFVAEKRLEEQKDLFETVLNSSPNAIQVLDAIRDEEGQRIIDFQWRYHNLILQSYFPERDLLGKTLSVEYPASTKNGLIDKLKEVVLQGEWVDFDHLYEQNGFHTHFNACAVRLEDSVVLTMQDVTQRVQNEEKVRALNKTLEQKNRHLESMNEQLSTFAFVASHDLREPLRKISYFINAMMEVDGEQLCEKSKVYMQKVLLSLQRMNTMITDVLKYSKTNSNGEDFGDVDLNNVLTIATNDLSEAIKEKKAVISSNNLPKIRGNKIQLIQLFENLVSNAIKFHNPGQPPEIDVIGSLMKGKKIRQKDADAEKNYAVISVSDKGIGFEETYSSKIFQMFQRLHGITEYPGTGMGLAICKRIVENHGGFMAVRSKPGEGSTFSCYFPAGPDGD
jgi:PAS domain S-box-containing protein